MKIKYLALYPLKYGAECERRYDTLTVAKREVVKHCKKAEIGFHTAYGDVYEIIFSEPGEKPFFKKTLIFSYEF